MGLGETHHISEVLIHPSNPDIVYVAAQGHLWGYNQERGVFKTTDGGRTWRHLTRGLPDDGRTGASDLVMDPTDPDVLYVGFWERIRFPHRFLSGGPSGGVFKSTDGGESWTKLTNGLPSGDTGKIGLAIYRRDPRILEAIIEHGFQPPAQIDRQPNPEYEDMTRLGTGLYRSEDGGESWEFVNRRNDRPFYYSHIWIDPNEPERVYVLDDNALVSEDGGRTFGRSFEGIEGDFHALWIDPNNSLRLYTGNDKGASASYDGGETFILFDNIDASQFYAVSADMRDPYWVYGGLQDNGVWGGPSNSRDANGILTDHWFKFHSGDGFHTEADPTDWRTVYTESENGNLRRLDPVFRQSGKSIRPTPATVLNFEDVVPGYTGSMTRLPGDRFRFNWSTELALSPHDPKTVYLGGNYLFKSTDRGDTWTIISPDLSTADTALANPETGGLTRDVTGAEAHATIITMSESPLLPGVIWAGTDDGNLQLTLDGGANWTNVRENIPATGANGVPEGIWVSRVEASHFDAGTAYATFDGHRSDDFHPYAFKTTDFGRSWTKIIGTNQGNRCCAISDHEPVYVIKEDLKNPELLFLGTEFSAYASVDGGESWHRINNNLPTVPVHDLLIHPRDGDLIAATHGRGIWILDDITPLQQLNERVMASPAHVFRNRVATTWHAVNRGATRGHMMFMGRNPLTITQRDPSNSPSDLENSAAVHFWVGSEPAGPVQLEIIDMEGAHRFSAQIPAARGINRYFWNLRFDPSEEEIRAAQEQQQQRGAGGGGFGRGFGSPRGAMAGPGTYRLFLTVGGQMYEGTLTVRDDPDIKEVS